MANALTQALGVFEDLVWDNARIQIIAQGRLQLGSDGRGHEGRPEIRCADRVRLVDNSVLPCFRASRDIGIRKAQLQAKQSQQRAQNDAQPTRVFSARPGASTSLFCMRAGVAPGTRLISDW